MREELAIYKSSPTTVDFILQAPYSHTEKVRMRRGLTDAVATRQLFGEVIVRG